MTLCDQCFWTHGEHFLQDQMQNPWKRMRTRFTMSTRHSWAISSQNDKISEIFHTPSVTPAAIAGVTRKDL